MTKKMKLLEKAKRNPAGLLFKELQTLMAHHDWVLDHQKGSHQIWISPESFRLSIQNRDGKAKSYQVKQFLKRLDEETKNA